jgi:predicted transcriptional regulator YdeE
MDVKFVEKGPIRLVGVVTHGKPDEITPQMMDIWGKRFMKHEAELKPYSADKAYYGAWIGSPDMSADYLAGMRVENLPEIPDGMEERVLPAAKYAIFPCTAATLGDTYGMIYGQWLPQSIYEFDSMAADFEYYLPDSEAAEVYIPVKEKEKVGE